MINNVLIVDDDEAIVDMVKDFLNLYGVRNDQIFTTSDPIEGLEIFRLRKDTISMLIIDYYMPKSNGDELCEILKKNQPDLCVILQTGDTNIQL